MKARALSLIIKERQKRGITQTEMAELISKKINHAYSTRAYQMLEGGKFPKYKKDVIHAIDEILGINAEALIYEGNNVAKNGISNNIQLNVEELYVIQAQIMALRNQLAKHMARDQKRPVDECLDELEQNADVILRDILKGK